MIVNFYRLKRNYKVADDFIVAYITSDICTLRRNHCDEKLGAMLEYPKDDDYLRTVCHKGMEAMFVMLNYNI